MTSLTVRSRADNFLHDSQTQHKIRGLGLGDLTHLIQWVGLGLTYIIL
jgi:hypothetical protein